MYFYLKVSNKSAILLLIPNDLTFAKKNNFIIRKRYVTTGNIVDVFKLAIKVRN